MFPWFDLDAIHTQHAQMSLVSESKSIQDHMVRPLGIGPRLTITQISSTLCLEMLYDLLKIAYEFKTLQISQKSKLIHYSLKEKYFEDLKTCLRL